MTQADNISAQQAAGPILAHNVDEEPVASNQRLHAGWLNKAVILLCIAYTAFHIGVMNLYPLETWTYRLIHVCGGLLLGFLIYSAVQLPITAPGQARRNPIE